MQRLRDVDEWCNTTNADDIRYMVDLHNRDKSIQTELLASIHDANVHRVDVQRLITILKNGIALALFICVVPSNTLVCFKSTTVAHFHKKFMAKYFDLQTYIESVGELALTRVDIIMNNHAATSEYIGKMNVEQFAGNYDNNEEQIINKAMDDYNTQRTTVNQTIAASRGGGAGFTSHWLAIYKGVTELKRTANNAIGLAKGIHARLRCVRELIGQPFVVWDDAKVRIPEFTPTVDVTKRILLVNFLNLLHSSAEQLEGHMGLTRTTDIQIVEDNINQSIEDVIATVDRGNSNHRIAASHSDIGESLRRCIHRPPLVVSNGDLIARVGQWLSERRYGESEYIAEQVDAKRQRTGQFVSVDNQLPLNVR